MVQPRAPSDVPAACSDAQALKTQLAAPVAPKQNGVLQESAADHSTLLAGLRQTPKHLPCSYLYDSRGSDLYEQITELEEYYPFKTEQTLLTHHANDIITHIPAGRMSIRACIVHEQYGSPGEVSDLQDQHPAYLQMAVAMW